MSQDPFSNFAMITPKFVSYRINGILLSGHETKVYKEFEEWLKTGSFLQCQLKGMDINVWYGKFYFDMPYMFCSLQQLLEAWIEWQKPKEIGFKSYKFNIK